MNRHAQEQQVRLRLKAECGSSMRIDPTGQTQTRCQGTERKPPKLSWDNQFKKLVTKRAPHVWLASDCVHTVCQLRKRSSIQWPPGELGLQLPIFCQTPVNTLCDVFGKGEQPKTLGFQSRLPSIVPCFSWGPPVDGGQVLGSPRHFGRFALAPLLRCSPRVSQGLGPHSFPHTCASCGGSSPRAG